MPATDQTTVRSDMVRSPRSGNQASLTAAFTAALTAAFDAALEAALEAAFDADFEAALEAALDAALDADFEAALDAALTAAFTAILDKGTTPSVERKFGTRVGPGCRICFPRHHRDSGIGRRTVNPCRRKGS